MQEQINKQQSQTYVGIDVSKDQLDIFIDPVGISLQVKNNKTGIQSLIRTLHKHEIGLAALEATGKYHRPAHTMLHDAGFAVSVINPFRSRQFTDSLGWLAKTDRIDAKALALYAQRMNPPPTEPPGEAFKLLRELQTARRQVIEEVSNLKRQSHTTDHPIAVRQIRARIAMGERHREILEKEIHQAIAADPVLKNKFDILVSIPGIGQTSASILLTELSELGQVNARQIAALAGVAPMNWDSGTKQGKRMIRGGRRYVRKTLYMCAVTRTTRSDFMGNTYRNLVRRGKQPKVALAAVMRKMVILANTLIAENRKWQAQAPAETCRPCLA